MFHFFIFLLFFSVFVMIKPLRKVAIKANIGGKLTVRQKNLWHAETVMNFKWQHQPSFNHQWVELPPSLFRLYENHRRCNSLTWTTNIGIVTITCLGFRLSFATKLSSQVLYIWWHLFELKNHDCMTCDWTPQGGN